MYFVLVPIFGQIIICGSFFVYGLFVLIFLVISFKKKKNCKSEVVRQEHNAKNVKY